MPIRNELADCWKCGESCFLVTLSKNNKCLKYQDIDPVDIPVNCVLKQYFLEKIINNSQ